MPVTFVDDAVPCKSGDPKESGEDGTRKEPPSESLMDGPKILGTSFFCQLSTSVELLSFLSWKLTPPHHFIGVVSEENKA